MAAKIKKGDSVVVIAGRDKGTKGEVLKVLVDEDRVVVRGVNVVKKHQKPSQMDPGGLKTFEAPIHVSNVMLVEGDGVTRIGFRRDEVTKRRPDGSTYAATRSVRISRKSGKEI